MGRSKKTPKAESTENNSKPTTTEDFSSHSRDQEMERKSISEDHCKDSSPTAKKGKIAKRKPQDDSVVSPSAGLKATLSKDESDEKKAPARLITRGESVRPCDEKSEGPESKNEKGKSKKGRKKRKDSSDEEEEREKMLTELESEMQSKNQFRNSVSEQHSEERVLKLKKSSTVETDHTSDTRIKRKNEVADDLVDGSTVKSAAQKKKDKKERERQQKMEQKAKEWEKERKRDKSKVKIEEAPVEFLKHEDNENEELKKKNNVKDEKEGKKRLGKKQLAAMQEHLKRMKEKEKRRKLEEEAKIKAAEEAERLQLEQLRLEQERKERKKQKEKERKERLKAEGKLITKTQKMQRARAAATLEAFQQQGIVPAVADKTSGKISRLGTRIRMKKNKSETATGTRTEVSKEELAQGCELLESEEETVEPDKNEIKDDDDAKESWDIDSASVKIDDMRESWDMDSDSESLDAIDSHAIKSAAKKRLVEVSVPTKKIKLRTKQSPEAESTASSEDFLSAESSEESNSKVVRQMSITNRSSEISVTSKKSEKVVSTQTNKNASLKIQKYDVEVDKVDNSPTKRLRSPIVCVLGHVDTGKTKLLDYIRRSHIQDSEAGGITQQIGATMVPTEAIKEQGKFVKNINTLEFNIPGLLIIDTPGHESFSNLRSRGSSLCDIAILVVDIMHGLEPQTLESINLLKEKKTPFIVALNKIDRLYNWKITKNRDIHSTIKSQAKSTILQFEQRTREVITQFAEQGLNAVLFYENNDPRTYVSLVPTSAVTGEGMGDLLCLVVQLTQQMLERRITFSEKLQCTVLEVKAIPGLGTTIDVILVNGRLHEGDTIILAGHDGPIVTQIRSLLMPQPLKELRVKNPYHEFKEIDGAQGIKITGKDLDKVIAGLNLVVAGSDNEIESCKEEVQLELQSVINTISLSERGVYVQASTLGSLEALLEFLKTSKIPYSNIRIGPVVKRDVMKASIMLEHDIQYAVILAFDVKIERDAQEIADSLGVKIFAAEIIYHLFDKFTAFREEFRLKKRDEVKTLAVFPCKLRILPQFIFIKRSPIVIGVSIEDGVLKEGTPICVPSKEFLDIGIVTTIEINHKLMESARKGQEVCIKIDPVPGETPKMFGRHFDHNDILVSKVSRQSIDVCKEHFRDDLQRSDWQLMIELKKLFEIL